MKIGIATWQCVLNHGALLQAIASKKVLEQMGHTVTYVDFQAQNAGYTSPVKPRSTMLFWNKLGRRLFTKKKIRIFRQFRQQNITLLPSKCSTWDAVMIGSDEVFSIEGGFNMDLFGVNYRCPVFSYAASCGPSTKEQFAASEYREQIAAGLRMMKGIGVRDQNTYDIVYMLTGITPVMNIDPVLLYAFKDEIAQMGEKPRKHIGLYAYTFRWDNDSEIETVKQYAKLQHENVDSLGFHHGWCDRNIVVDPLQMLQQFKSHRLIITDTFHGTIMAVITHTPFCVKVRNNSPKLLHLLKILDLEERQITKLHTIEQIANETIDFDHVEKRLETYRKQSMDYLSTMLECCGGTNT